MLSGGIPPLRDRRLAAVFIVVMYGLLVVAATSLLAVGLLSGNAVQGTAVAAGAVLGAAFGAWRVRRAPASRADGGGGPRA